ncbi:hypothetical protein RND71_020146 [Anisodus tanguticus]|uniref:Uncharacterized protein n=1 Tax=Anisodus tanguticus TaxID=243964 RepID=A0AAE1VH83_9SOLA|nr:hypothetical protein RND71_020146 [Anisodus tanguticus]
MMTWRKRRMVKTIEKFGEIYERVEGMKQRQMVELEKQRMQFAKDLEVQRMQLFMDTQVQLEKIKHTKRSAGSHDNAYKYRNVLGHSSAETKRDQSAQNLVENHRHVLVVLEVEKSLARYYFMKGVKEMSIASSVTKEHLKRTRIARLWSDDPSLTDYDYFEHE